MQLVGAGLDFINPERAVRLQIDPVGEAAPDMPVCLAVLSEAPSAQPLRPIRVSEPGGIRDVGQFFDDVDARPHQGERPTILIDRDNPAHKRAAACLHEIHTDGLAGDNVRENGLVNANRRRPRLSISGLPVQASLARNNPVDDELASFIGLGAAVMLDAGLGPVAWLVVKRGDNGFKSQHCPPRAELTFDAAPWLNAEIVPVRELLGAYFGISLVV